VVRALHARGDEVAVLQRTPSDVAAELGLVEYLGDLNDAGVVSRATAGRDGVIHLAARVGVVGTGSQFRATNIEGTRCVLGAARAAGVARFVFISSPSVAHAGRALVGEPAGAADPAHAKGHYSRTKAAAELEVLAADAPGFPTIAVRPHLVWGPGDTQLVERIAERSRSGRLPLVGAGRALIDTTYLDNAVSAIVAALDRAPQAHGRAFVVSNGQPRPVAEIMAAVCAAAGAPPPRGSVPAGLAWVAGALVEGVWAVGRRTDDPPMTRFLARQLATAHWFDLRETQQCLGWEPTVSLDEGFGRLREWFSAQRR
jgi:nucleoside-diphosphate-sugar epimerase